MTEKLNFNVLVLDEGDNSGVKGALAELHTASENNYITKTLEPNINALMFVIQIFKNRGNTTIIFLRYGIAHPPGRFTTRTEKP